MVFSEAYRVLSIDGVLYIADWGKPSNLIMRFTFYIVQFLDGFKNTRANVEGRLPELIRGAGFSHVEVSESIDTVLGTISIICAKK